MAGKPNIDSKAISFRSEYSSAKQHDSSKTVIKSRLWITKIQDSENTASDMIRSFNSLQSVVSKINP